MTLRTGWGLAIAFGVACVAAVACGPRDAAAQTAGQLGAWDGLTISPVGAVAPIAHDAGDLATGVNEVSLRYGRWRYDADDVVHDNIGLSWTHGLGFANSRFTLIGVYEIVECPTCSAWMMAGANVESTVWTHAFASADARPVTSGAALRFSFGGGHYLGGGGTSTASVSLEAPIDLSVPLGATSSLCGSIIPGFGFGRISSTDETASGVLPMIGAAISWKVTSRLNVDVGLERIIISGGPTVVGAALSLEIGAKRKAHP